MTHHSHPDDDRPRPSDVDHDDEPRTRHDRTSDACHMGECRLCEEQQERDEQEDETCDATAGPSCSTMLPDSSPTPTASTATAVLARALQWPGSKPSASPTQQATYATTTPETT